MALYNYGVTNWIITVNGRDLKDWGQTDPAVTHEQINDQSILQQGIGGTAVRLDRVNAGRKYTINLQAGSPDSAYMQGLLNSNATVTITTVQVGTLETTIASQGVITGDGQVGRASVTSASDDQYIIDCNYFEQTKGGK